MGRTTTSTGTIWGVFWPSAMEKDKRWKNATLRHGGEVDYFTKNGIVQEEFSDSLIDRGFTGHEHFEETSLIHMNGRMYEARMKRFLSPDNNIQDPYDTRSYDRFAYTWNNPLMANDPSGEFLVAALIGAAIGLITNGINNTMNGRGFFEGGLKAALIGAISGALSFGIGEIAAGIKGTLLSTGISKASAFQFVAHGALGGVMTAANGGKFIHGFISGGVASVAGGIGDKIFKGGFVGTTLSGGFAGGLGSLAAGGKFWDGFRNGAISAGLNEAMHSAQASAKRSDPAWKDYFNAMAENAEIALAGGGALYGTGEVLTASSQLGYWLGNNGRYYSTAWGGNRFTGSRAGAFKASNAFKLAGRVTFWGGAFLSGMNARNYLLAGNYPAFGKSMLDVGMGALATFGGVGGLVVGSGYLLIDYTIGWNNAMNNMHHMTTQTQRVHGRTWNPYKQNGY